MATTAATITTTATTTELIMQSLKIIFIPTQRAIPVYIAESKLGILPFA